MESTSDLPQSRDALFHEKHLEEDLAHRNDYVNVNNDFIILSPAPTLSLSALSDTLRDAVTAVHTL